MGGFIINLWSIYISMNNNKLNEILDKYQVTEKNVSTGTFKSLKETIIELDKLDKVLLLIDTIGTITILISQSLQF